MRLVALSLVLAFKRLNCQLFLFCKSINGNWGLEMLKCDFQYQHADFILNVELEMQQQLLGIVGASVAKVPC